MIGRATFRIKGAETEAVLGDARRDCPSAPQPATTPNRLFVFRLVESPIAECDPLDAAVVEAAEVVHGVYELEPSESQKDGAVHLRATGVNDQAPSTESFRSAADMNLRLRLSGWEVSGCVLRYPAGVVTYIAIAEKGGERIVHEDPVRDLAWWRVCREAEALGQLMDWPLEPDG
jgi:hypothetical protein